MSVYTQYAEGVRASRASWDQFVDAAIYGAKKYADQACKSATVNSESTADVFNYATRAVELQADVTKRFGAATAEYATVVLGQWELLAQATRDYAARAEQILRDQVASHNGEYAHAAERASAAFTTVGTVTTPNEAAKGPKASKAAV